jgi:hypothetical protein
MCSEAVVVVLNALDTRGDAAALVAGCRVEGAEANRCARAFQRNTEVLSMCPRPVETHPCTLTYPH